VLVTVLDNGPGLGANARKDVPDMPSSSKPDGMGVGLMWTRALLRRWGGDFTLADRPEAEGAGVRAECRLALAPSWVLGTGSIEPGPDDGPL
jgi:nitrogen fixation/metabolism regulation signal transduction histidine kinase